MPDAEEHRHSPEERRHAQGPRRCTQETVLIMALRRVEETHESAQHVVAAFNNYV